MKTTDIERLEQQIEQLIREHLVECARRAMLAVERGFGTTANRTAPRRVEGACRVPGQRRSDEALDGLADRLAAAVCATPGATMVVLAAEVGAPVRELVRPAKRLKKAGRIRTVGERNMTRYFPLPAKRSTARGQGARVKSDGASPPST
jgi:hypothetical protein